MAEQASVAEDPTLTKASSATTAEFTLSADAFAFAALFRRVPEASVECKPVVATPTDRAIVVIDADADDEQIHNALEDDPVLGAIESFDKRSGRWTYQVTWTGQPRELFAKLRSASVTVLSAQATNGSWTFRILVFERTHINRAEHVLTDLDRQADWIQISPLDASKSNHSSLTDEQHEALIEAFKVGYYRIPRENNMKEIAERLDISHQALSERLRRAHSQLIQTTLLSG